MFEKIIDSFGRAQKQQEDNVQEINLHEVMLAHIFWKKRLLEYLDGRYKDEMEISQVCTVHHCELGKWLHSDGKAYFGEQPAFIKLMDEHAKFHAHAAQIVETHRGGDSNYALEILNGSFNAQATRLVNSLTKFNAVVEASNEGC